MDSFNFAVEVNNVSVLDDISFSLLLAILLQLVLVFRMRQQSVCVQYLSIDESFPEISVNLHSGLNSIFPLSNCPSSHLVFAHSIKMNYLELFVTCLNDLRDFWFLALLFILLMLYRVLYIFGSIFTIFGHYWLDFRKVRNFIIQIIFLWHVQ